LNTKYTEIIKLSVESLKNSYSPYSKFKVGAAILTNKGNIYNGSNIESESFSLTLCAERVAFAKAISNGDKKIKAIAIATSVKNYVFPCGACRQFMNEFSDDLDIILVKSLRNYKIFKLKDLLPKVFSLK
jgi:cytidine deaminase